MKKFLLITAMLFACGVAFAAVEVEVDGTLYGAATTLNFPAGTTVTQAGSTFAFNTPSTGSVASITSGTIAGAAINTTTIGATTPSTGRFTTATTSGNIGIGTTRTSMGALEIDGSIYIPAGSATAGSALCITTAQLVGHCTSTPTSGACTCVAN